MRVQPDYRLNLWETSFEFQSPKMLPIHVGIRINDDEVWEHRRARLRELELVNGPHRQVEFRYHVYPLLHAAMKDGKVDDFISALEKYSAEEGVSLSNIVIIRGPSRNSLLHIAAGIENPDILRALLEVGPDRCPTFNLNHLGDNPLHIAARAGKIQTAELLLRCNMYADVQNGVGNTALHEAVKKRDSNMTRLLLRHGSRSVFRKNSESRCPLYLAVETGKLEILELLLNVDGNEDLMSGMLGLSPVHKAVKHKRLDMLRRMLERKKQLFDLRGAGDDTPLHLAAYENYVEGVNFLVQEFTWSTYVGNKKGHLPIHIACKMGHLETTKELLQNWPDPEELLTLNKRRNILHLAAKYGRVSVVKYILGDPKFEKLINAKDREGNTPLHIATLNWQPESLTGIILVSAGARRSKDEGFCQTKSQGLARGLESSDRLKTEANTRMVVATLVATITFAAGFSVPGGYNNSEPDAGIATLLNKPIYDIFVISNTIAMYSSIISAVILLWTQISDSVAMLYALKRARTLLLIALLTMGVAFMAGVYVTISKRNWIAIVIWAIGTIALSVILSLYLALFFPLGYNSRFVRLFADYIIRAGILISRSVAE
ncbi:protein ACCELERATED CELL DEATH 6-like [Eucalyptus grandis]|uniref:protein ACCELERATED CELL DEATH 6-like n=1 Tax=Eucalyptus grandis TaxID=71139 RepID=UPI00192EF944|nr:protein ACCELERATED CELL DEATH 6-like [Eucalyptus grandis]